MTDTALHNPQYKYFRNQLKPEHRDVFSLLMKRLGSFEFAKQEWRKFERNVGRVRTLVLNAADLTPDEIAMLLVNGTAVPNSLFSKTLLSPTGLQVSINGQGRPHKWVFTPNAKGSRGPWHTKVKLGNDGKHRGHIYAVQLGADDNIVDDGVLNIIPQSQDFNLIHYRYFEKYALSSLLGHKITVSQSTPNGLISIQVPSKGIDVNADPQTIRKDWPTDWYLMKNTWR
jgi:hypothetical protein